MHFPCTSALILIFTYLTPTAAFASAGVQNVRDVITFPRAAKSATF